MEKFIYEIPTKVYFGEGQIIGLKEEVKKYGTRLLLVYGGNSIKRNGIYESITKLLDEAGVELWEESGVQPNPKITSVERGVRTCREHDIQMVLAVGGGSCIDCAKAIAAGACSESEPWNLVLHSEMIQKVLPIMCVVTLAATGSEMDGIAVINNPTTNEKRPMKHPKLRPSVAVLDPTYTYSVPKYQTAAGTADIMSHLMETYFSRHEGYMQARMEEALMKTCIHYGPIAMRDPENYEARANLMWTSTWAINDMLKCGRPVTWSVHAIEHQLSAYYEVTHGVGLAVLTPHWMRKVLSEQTVDDFAMFARNVWHVEEEDSYKAAEEGIRELEAFFRVLELPETLREAGVKDQRYFQNMAEKAMPFLKDTYVALTKDDVIDLYEKSF
jgi:butanol dehydrogenase